MIKFCGCPLFNTCRSQDFCTSLTCVWSEVLCLPNTIFSSWSDIFIFLAVLIIINFYNFLYLPPEIYAIVFCKLPVSDINLPTDTPTTIYFWTSMRRPTPTSLPRTPKPNRVVPPHISLLEPYSHETAFSKYHKNQRTKFHSTQCQLNL